MTERKSRAASTRDATDRASKARPDLDAWSPAQMIYGIPDLDGMRYKWVREEVNGVPDPRNVQQHIQEGYTRVQIEDVPEGAFYEEDNKGDKVARWGGLMLMRIPVYKAEQRQAHYQGLAAQAQYSADALQGVAGANAVVEDRGSRSLEGVEAGQALANMSRT